MVYRRCTPVVVSSDTPTIRAAILCHFFGSLPNSCLMIRKTCLNSGFDSLVGSGLDPSDSNFFSHFTPSWMSKVASPPSSTIKFGPSSFGHVNAARVQSQYSSNVSPFHANTADVLALAMAAAAWSCVENMLHEHQRISAPNACNVSIKTAVCIVKCKDPVILAPLSGCLAFISATHDMRPGISTSASLISLRPYSHCLRSRIL
mmetsp:Transcript_33372/g.53473  ORF Transcript_33372/g.53473 Transcript_33372/m.53473 type:complete len:204 (+) Transcript_33372:822-1433(+)